VQELATDDARRGSQVNIDGDMQPLLLLPILLLVIETDWYRRLEGRSTLRYDCVCDGKAKSP
jgi:hypothetical protein